MIKKIGIEGHYVDPAYAKCTEKVVIPATVYGDAWGTGDANAHERFALIRATPETAKAWLELPKRNWVRNGMMHSPTKAYPPSSRLGETVERWELLGFFRTFEDAEKAWDRAVFADPGFSTVG